MAGRVRELPDSTRTAAEAAAAVGCEVGQIVKSLVMRTAAGEPVLVIASGANRVDEAKVWAAAGTPRAVFPLSPDELLRVTGGRVAAVAQSSSSSPSSS